MEDGTSDRGSGRTGRRFKVERLVDEYGIDGAEEDLERGWTATGTEHESLRELAERFNQRLLERVLVEAGIRPVDGEIRTFYRTLAEEGVSEGDRMRLMRRLERDGIDVEELRSDFVSYQAVRSFLRQKRGVTGPVEGTSRMERTADHLQKLVGRTEAVTRSKFTQLRDTGRLDLGEFGVYVDVRVTCRECGEQYLVVELLEAGGCTCVRAGDDG
jgi:hypothetical protein